MSAPQKILDLVANFSQNADHYQSAQFNEANLRIQFVNPLFKCLGWDVDNEQGSAPDYQDVIHEASVVVDGTTKAPDYSFGIGRDRKFFVEAKKPAVNIKKAPEPAYQLRRYAWSKKLPLSILTNFAEFAVYDGRVPPRQDDRSSVARISYFTYDQLPEKWDELAATYSKPAILKGSFDKFAQSAKGKRGTATVDALFLQEIEDWRLHLARNLANRNPSLDQRSLNYAVQMTIDRIIFLRMCEDRGIEDYGQLRDLAGEDDIYKHLKQLFVKADRRFNSGLFHFAVEEGRDEPPDTITPKLKIDDKLLKTIIKRLYYPESPYVFSEIPPEILGQVYEQFLGKVITLTRGHIAKVEDKPEVKKGGGVYYTPSYIVDYIVKHTVGKLLDGSDPKKASKLRILDPACGSGSFLLGAYQYLLDWHRDWYEKNNPTKYPKAVFQSPAPGGVGPAGWRLTTGERKQILLNNIYGVDIDTQAVEVTKLALLLKVLEGETRANLDRDLFTEHERALPDLSANIKCGNSLIGPDFYDGKQLTMFDEEEQYRINVFDWNAGFPAIMKAGGFDAVIGNPPYIRIHRIGHDEADYLFRRYEGPSSKTDLSLVFIEKGLQLIGPKGYACFISTSQWLATDYGKNVRRTLSDGRLHEIVDFGSLPVFAASTYPGIFLLANSKAAALRVKQIRNENQLNLGDIESVPWRSIHLEDLGEMPWNFGSFDLVKHLQRHKANWLPLLEFGKAYIGTKSGMTPVFALSRSDARREKLEKKYLLPYAYQGSEVSRYGVTEPDAVIIYPYEEGNNGRPELVNEARLRSECPRIHARLVSFKSELRQRQDSRRLYADGPDWYRHLRPGSFNYIRPEKLVVKGIAKRCEVGLLRSETAFDGANCPAIIIEDFRGHSVHYLLGILNSKLATAFLKTVCPPKLSGYIRFSSSYVGEVPIRLIDFASPADKSRHDQIVQLVERMLTLHEQLTKARTPQAQTSLQAQIDATDRQIDQIVYELYGLTPEEVGIVEATTGLASKSTEDEAGQPAGGNGDTYVPYQPALDAGISPEMDRLNFRRIQLAERKARGLLTAEEEAEFAQLQERFSAYIATLFPRASILDDDRLEKLEAKYKINQ